MTPAEFESILTCADPVAKDCAYCAEKGRAICNCPTVHLGDVESVSFDAKCWCETCVPHSQSMRMILCPDCGNKRCPKARNHENPCTGSNAVGQKGSSWEHVKPFDSDASRARAHVLPRILAIDPGNEQSGWVIYGGGRVEASGVFSNQRMLTLIENEAHPGAVMAIEAMSSYGMAVGKEVFETCVWAGRFVQAWRRPEEVMMVYRRDVKLYLCNSVKAKDSNVRLALLDMFPRTGGGKTPQIGTAKQQGPLYGVSSHAWAALGVAVTVADRINRGKA